MCRLIMSLTASGLFITITARRAQRPLILSQKADPGPPPPLSLPELERIVGSHGDRLRLARSNLPEMRSGNRAETPPARHERGKS